jgi:hypothetical protein
MPLGEGIIASGRGEGRRGASLTTPSSSIAGYKDILALSGVSVHIGLANYAGLLITNSVVVRGGNMRVTSKQTYMWCLELQKQYRHSESLCLPSIQVQHSWCV